MQMSGANNNYQFTGIQSFEAFSPPFTLSATVTGTIANGNPFELFLSNSNWSGSRLEIFGNINRANCGYYGIWANSVNDGICALNPYLLYQNAAVGVPYTFQISVDASGNLTLSLINNGVTLAQAAGSGFIGPFYLILGQGEGSPCTGGSTNVGVWQYVGLASSNSPPSILAQPQGLTVGIGGTAVFGVTAIGATPLSYQWIKSGSNLVSNGNVIGTTNTTLTISNVSVVDAANYQVVVSNSFGSVTSSIAKLTAGQEIDLIPAPNVNQSVSLTNSNPLKGQLGLCAIENNLYGLAPSFTGQVVMTYFPNMDLLTNTIALGQMTVTSGGVAAYPEIEYGYKPWPPPWPPNSTNYYSSTNSAALLFPVKLGDLVNMESYGGFWAVANYAVSPIPPQNPMDFAYDIWITSSNPPVSVTATTVELMIWLYASNLTPSGTTPKLTGVPMPCLVNGQLQYLLFDVYASTNTSSNWAIVSFEPEAPLSAGSIGVDLSRIMGMLGSELQNWFGNSVWTQSSLSNFYVLDVELGSEFKDTSGSANYGWGISRYYFIAPPIPLTFGLGSAQSLTTNGFSFRLQGQLGSNYVVQASTNLNNWQPITNFVGTISPIYLNDPAAKNFKQRFYRAVTP